MRKFAHYRNKSINRGWRTTEFEANQIVLFVFSGISFRSWFPCRFFHGGLCPNFFKCGGSCCFATQSCSASRAGENYFHQFVSFANFVVAYFNLDVSAATSTPLFFAEVTSLVKHVAISHMFLNLLLDIFRPRRGLAFQLWQIWCSSFQFQMSHQRLSETLE